jgi:hypothetical protein
MIRCSSFLLPQIDPAILKRLSHLLLGHNILKADDFASLRGSICKHIHKVQRTKYDIISAGYLPAF